MIRGEEDPLEKEIATHSSILASPVAQTVKQRSVGCWEDEEGEENS